jgi:uncharacterized protein YbaA (DUF1428 family)
LCSSRARIAIASNAKVMKDPRITKTMNEPMPFDVKRMAYGGFDVLVDL